MKAVLTLVTVAILLFFFGGVGFITCHIQQWYGARIVFKDMLIGGYYVTMASLAIALVVGVYHLYLYMFTDRRPLSLFATTKKDS